MSRCVGGCLEPLSLGLSLAEALLSSPLRRAWETAAAIAAATGLRVQLDDRLRERLNWEGTQTFEAFPAD